VKTVFVKRDMELYMIDLSRERACIPVLKLDFTDYGIMKTLWSPLSEFGLGIFL